MMYYKPGKEMQLADYLNHSSNNLKWDNEVQGLKLTINDVAVESNILDLSVTD